MKKIMIILCGLMLLFSGCTKTMYVPVESVRVDTLYNTNIVRDSIYMHDSVYVENRTAGDTVYNTKYVTRWRDRYKTIHDTLLHFRTDTITQVQTVEVVRSPTFGERLKDIGTTILVFIALGIVSIFLGTNPKK